MSGFWSGWIIALIVINLGITLFLFWWAPRVKIPTESDGTSGHVWAHGVLREGIRPLPMWWIIFSACMFIAGFAYLALYPGFGSFKGALGWTSEGELNRAVEARNTKLQVLLERWRPLSFDQLAQDPDALRIGQRLYLDNCAACHGSTGHGNEAIGAPNLTDNEWLHGGDHDTILTSILDGRGGAMPAWGAVLGDQGVNETAAYVLSLTGVKSPEGWAEAGKARFDAVCVACHGADGRGNTAVGAPDLTDGVWLYGNDFRAVATTIREGRSGSMPAWRQRLGVDQSRLVAAWVVAQGSRSGSSATSASK